MGGFSQLGEREWTFRRDKNSRNGRNNEVTVGQSSTVVSIFRWPVFRWFCFTPGAPAFRPR